MSPCPNTAVRQTPPADDPSVNLRVFPAANRETEIRMDSGGMTKPCAGEGCTASISISDELCADCAMTAAREGARLRLYVSDGFERLEEYLGLWAVFEEAYGPN